jgi:CsoR family transcriptional regulator, copper-sensing transcriptional repressor
MGGELKRSKLKVNKNLKQVLSRLNRVQGQLDAICRMIDSQRFCLDIVTQLRAVNSALHSIEAKILSDRLEEYAHLRMHSTNEEMASQLRGEVLDLFHRGNTQEGPEGSTLS